MEEGSVRLERDDFRTPSNGHQVPTSSPNFVSKVGRVAGNEVDKQDGQQEVAFQQYSQPELSAFESHEPGGLVNLELVVLVLAYRWSREAEPRQMFPQLRHDKVKWEDVGERKHPQELAEDGLAGTVDYGSKNGCCQMDSNSDQNSHQRTDDQ